MAVETIAITAENTFSAAFQIPGNTDPQTKISFNFSIEGTFVANVVLQRRFGSSDAWRDVQIFTVPGEFVIDEIESIAQFRAGVKTGGFTSGTANLRIGTD